MARRKVTSPDVIIAKAAELFEERGYKNTTIDDIAGALGIAKPTVYKHVESKKWLLETIHESLIGEVRSNLEAIAMMDDPRAQLRAIVEYFMEAVDRLQPYFVIFFGEERELEPDTRRRFREAAREGNEQVANIVRRGQQAGVFRADVDPEIASQFIVGMLTSAVRWYEPSGPMGPADMAEEAYRLLEGFVRTPA